jgi:hypothetical protein
MVWAVVALLMVVTAVVLWGWWGGTRMVRRLAGGRKNWVDFEDAAEPVSAPPLTATKRPLGENAVPLSFVERPRDNAPERPGLGIDSIVNKSAVVLVSAAEASEPATLLQSLDNVGDFLRTALLLDERFFKATDPLTDRAFHGLVEVILAGGNVVALRGAKAILALPILKESALWHALKHAENGIAHVGAIPSADWPLGAIGTGVGFPALTLTVVSVRELTLVFRHRLAFSRALGNIAVTTASVGMGVAVGKVVGMAVAVAVVGGPLVAALGCLVGGVIGGHGGYTAANRFRLRKLAALHSQLEAFGKHSERAIHGAESKLVSGWMAAGAACDAALRGLVARLSLQLESIQRDRSAWQRRSLDDLADGFRRHLDGLEARLRQQQFDVMEELSSGWKLCRPDMILARRLLRQAFGRARTIVADARSEFGLVRSDAARVGIVSEFASRYPNHEPNLRLAFTALERGAADQQRQAAARRDEVLAEGGLAHAQILRARQQRCDAAYKAFMSVHSALTAGLNELTEKIVQERRALGLPPSEPDGPLPA